MKCFVGQSIGMERPTSDIEMHEALRHIDAIQDHLARAEVYRGFRVGGVATAGAIGLIAAALQPWIVDPGDGVAFVRYWLAVAIASGAVGGGAAVWAYVRREDEYSRRRTRQVFAQFAPCLAAGALVTVALPRFQGDALLPGLWALIFGLGIFAVRPHLPRAIGWVGLYYLAAGAFLLLRGGEPTGWDVGGVFGVGHLGSALVLHVNMERPCDEQTESG